MPTKRKIKRLDPIPALELRPVNPLLLHPNRHQHHIPKLRRDSPRSRIGVNIRVDRRHPVPELADHVWVRVGSEVLDCECGLGERAADEVGAAGCRAFVERGQDAGCGVEAGCDWI